jgi:uncharacterized integral membrane protein
VNNRLILILVLSGLAVLFIIQNAVGVEIRFLFWSIQISRSVLIVLFLTIGIIIGWLLHGNFKASNKQNDV